MAKASAYFSVDVIDGKHDIKEIKRELDKFTGVESVSISGQNIAVDFDTTGVEKDQIQKKLEKLGYNVWDARLENHIM